MDGLLRKNVRLMPARDYEYLADDDAVELALQVDGFVLAKIGHDTGHLYVQVDWGAEKKTPTKLTLRGHTWRRYGESDLWAGYERE